MRSDRWGVIRRPDGGLRIECFGPTGDEPIVVITLDGPAAEEFAAAITEEMRRG